MEQKLKSGKTHYPCILLCATLLLLTPLSAFSENDAKTQKTRKPDPFNLQTETDLITFVRAYTFSQSLDRHFNDYGVWWLQLYFDGETVETDAAYDPRYTRRLVEAKAKKLGVGQNYAKKFDKRPIIKYRGQIFDFRRGEDLVTLTARLLDSGIFFIKATTTTPRGITFGGMLLAKPHIEFETPPHFQSGVGYISLKKIYAISPDMLLAGGAYMPQLNKIYVNTAAQDAALKMGQFILNRLNHDKEWLELPEIAQSKLIGDSAYFEERRGIQDAYRKLLRGAQSFNAQFSNDVKKLAVWHEAGHLCGFFEGKNERTFGPSIYYSIDKNKYIRLWRHFGNEYEALADYVGILKGIEYVARFDRSAASRYLLLYYLRICPRKSNHIFLKTGHNYFFNSINQFVSPAKLDMDHFLEWLPSLDEKIGHISAEEIPLYNLKIINEPIIK